MVFEFAAVFLLGLLIYILLLSHGSVPSYWKKHGIPIIDASEAASNIELALAMKNITVRDDHAYKIMGDLKYCGMLERPSPIILVKDLDLIKKITIKNFEHFVDRREFFPVRKTSILRRMLGFLRGEEWKGVRATMSPTFTTGKIRRMMEIFNSVGKEWVEMLKEKSTPKGSVELRMLSSVNQFTVEVIASAVFGISTGSIQNADTMFAQKARRLTEMNFGDFLKFTLAPRYPKLFEMMGADVFDIKAMNFFESIMRQSIEERLKGNVTRNDFQQILLEAQKGELKSHGSDDLDSFEKDAKIEAKGQLLTDEIIVAQSLLFFIAGFLGTSSAITMTAYVLALHQEEQEKLRQAVKTIVKNGNLDYDSLNQLPYLEMVVQEVLRLYPLAVRLERECLKEYHDPESGLHVPKGGIVVIPVNGIHHDPQHFANADKFDPEHFSPEQKANRNPYAHMPFGLGPRNCIGMRFALVEVKAAIAHLVHNFKIEPTAKTPIPVQIIYAGMMSAVPPHLELKLTPIK